MNYRQTLPLNGQVIINNRTHLTEPFDYKTRAYGIITLKK